jgi:hypothetical protein
MVIKLSKDTPFVILLDLDNTIQGDIEPQLIESGLQKFLNVHNKSAKMKNLIIKDMNKGLLRPHFKMFITNMRELYPNVEFFIYTASEDKWGKYIASIIESSLGITLNKFVFTRSHCLFKQEENKYYKSISGISPKLFDLLKSKHKLTGKKNTYKFRHIYLIDNNEVLRSDESHHLIKCDDYKRKVIIDPLRNISSAIFSENFGKIGMYLNYSKTPIMNIMKFFSIHYTRLYKLYSIEKHVDKNDTFWLNALEMFRKSFVYNH